MNRKSLEGLLICQGMSLPFLWLIPIVIGFFIPEYNSVSQHISEITLYETNSAVSVIERISNYLIDTSIALFFIGLFLIRNLRLTFTVVLGMAYGIGMLSNSIFPTGTPLHGLWGLPIFSVIIPAIFALEYSDKIDSRVFVQYSIATTVLNLTYLWANVVSLDPFEYRGLTQRLAIYIINIWFAVAAFILYKNANETSA